MEEHFLDGYNKWKKNHKGMSIHYSSENSLLLGIKNVEMDLVDMLNEHHLGGLVLRTYLNEYIIFIIFRQSQITMHTM